MAIYHLTMKNISRTRRNTVASLAYRAGVKLLDSQTGEVFDCTSKPVSSVEFYIPENAPHQKTPQWAKDLQELIFMDKEKGTQAISDLVEAAEKRIDARIYKEVKFALPKELTEEQCKILWRRFIQKNLADKGILSLGNYHDLKTDKPLRTDSKPKLNPFKIERSTRNPFKVEKASGNPFDVRGMGVNKILLTIS